MQRKIFFIGLIFDVLAGIDWEALRSTKPPQLLSKGQEEGAHEEFDWRLSSLALSQPLRFEYEDS